MNIDIVCNDGSPLGVTCASIYGDDGRTGVGGAELAMLTLAEAWHTRGDHVTVYNNPNTANGSPFEHRFVNEFRPEAERDILIVFRSPNPLSINARGKKVWFSCDQYTVGDFKQFSDSVDEIVVISQFHADYFETMYGIRDVHVIDLPVRQQDYQNRVSKLAGQCLFSSVPDRGLPILAECWPRIVAEVPEASLVITSGWSLWTGQSDAPYIAPYRLMFQTAKNVEYKGAVKRNELIQLQMQSEILAFPCTYDELFCIAAAEAQWVGAWPITSNMGALSTTNMGTRIIGHPSSPEWKEQFIRSMVEHLMNPNTPNLSNHILQKARNRFSTKRILEQWDDVFAS